MPYISDDLQLLHGTHSRQTLQQASNNRVDIKNNKINHALLKYI